MGSLKTNARTSPVVIVPNAYDVLLQSGSHGSGMRGNAQSRETSKAVFHKQAAKIAMTGRERLRGSGNDPVAMLIVRWHQENEVSPQSSMEESQGQWPTNDTDDRWMTYITMQFPNTWVDVTLNDWRSLVHLWLPRGSTT